MHNHSLSPNREKFFNGIEFTQEMCERVEFYVNVIKLKPLQIKKALEKEFPDCKIYLFKVHKATAKFYCEKRKDISNDAASLYEDLLRKKEKDPRWYIAINWDRETHTLFPEVDKALSRFLMPAMLKIQRLEIKSCLNYQASSITKAELIKYQEPELDTAQFIEDGKDLMQSREEKIILTHNTLLLKKEIKTLQEENQSAEQTERFFAGED
ncbi:146_t:CDS:2, partial [Gigaspora rosea]